MPLFEGRRGVFALHRLLETYLAGEGSPDGGSGLEDCPSSQAGVEGSTACTTHHVRIWPWRADTGRPVSSARAIPGGGNKKEISS